MYEALSDRAGGAENAGAKVLHARVLPLAAETEMVVWVRNTFNPRVRGTRIGPAIQNDSSPAALGGRHNPISRGEA